MGWRSAPLGTSWNSGEKKIGRGSGYSEIRVAIAGEKRNGRINREEERKNVTRKKTQIDYG